MKNNFKEKLAHILFFACAMAAVAALGTIFIFIFLGGAPQIIRTGLFRFLLGSRWKPTRAVPQYGILPMITGTCLVTLTACALGLPTGLMRRMYLAYFCPDKLQKPLGRRVDLMAGIPSVVYGFFGIMTIVPAVRKFFGGNGNSVLSAGILLGIMILPTMISASCSSLKAVPSSYLEGSIALGATKEQAAFRTALPAAVSGVAARRVLSIGRAVGETMAVQMVAGNQPRITFDLRKGARTMTANIALEMAEAAGEHRRALISTGLVLFFRVLAINGRLFILKRRAEGEK